MKALEKGLWRCKDCKNWNPTAVDDDRTGFGVCIKMLSSFNHQDLLYVRFATLLKGHDKKEELLDELLESIPSVKGQDCSSLAFSEDPDGSVVTSPYFGCVMFEPKMESRRPSLKGSESFFGEECERSDRGEA